MAGSAWAEEPACEPAERLRLDNGLEVVLQEDHRTPLVAVVSSVDVGFRQDPKGYAGLAHYVEHLLFRGKTPDQEVMARYRRAAALSVNARTTADLTEYFALVPAEQLELALWIEARRFAVGLSEVTEEQALAEAEVVRREFALSKRAAGRAFRSTMLSSLFTPEHPYHKIEQSEQTLEALGLVQARWFHEQLYSMGRTRLVLVGDFDAPQAKALIEEYWSGLRDSAPAPPPGVAGRADLVHTLESPSQACRFRTEGRAQPPRHVRVRVPYKNPGFELFWPVPAGQDPAVLLRVLQLWADPAVDEAREAGLTAGGHAFLQRQSLASFVGLHFPLPVGKNFQDVEKVVWRHYADFLAASKSESQWVAMAQGVELSQALQEPNFLQRALRLAARHCSAVECESSVELTQQRAGELAALLSRERAVVTTSEYDFGTSVSGPVAEVVR